MSCLFCDIIDGKVPSTEVFRNDTVYAFEDISPQAPVHVLVVHREHLENCNDLNNTNSATISDIFLAVKEVAKIKNINETGYRVIINNGPAAGQVIWHLHIHVLGGSDNLGPMMSLPR